MKARYIMIGGFLGAGKSTAMARLARRLSDDGTRVGLITNDQGEGLVDTSRLRAEGFRVEEIPGGCFCCRFDSLLEAARQLTDATRPDVFLAEPVGSCTDLVATVSYPLRRIYGNEYTIAPLSVLVDPVRAARVFGLAKGRRRSFSRKVLYVYRKQLEEASFIVVNKCDLIERPERERLRDALASEYPGKRIFEVSARTGDGLDAWFDTLFGEEIGPGLALNIDYDAYAEGEALLGWLNATVVVSSAQDFDANVFLREVAGRLGERLEAARAEIAHLKMTFSPQRSILNELAAVSLVRGDLVPELAQELAEPVTAGELIVNLRAEADPEVLRAALEAELQERSRRAMEDAAGPFTLRLEHVECFQPGRPSPTHRQSEF